MIVCIDEDQARYFSIPEKHDEPPNENWYRLISGSWFDEDGGEQYIAVRGRRTVVVMYDDDRDVISVSEISLEREREFVNEVLNDM